MRYDRGDVPISSYADLPDAVQSAVEAAVGAPRVLQPALGGPASTVASRLSTDRGEFFVKAVPAGHRSATSQEREAEICRHVGAVAPALITRILDRGWDVLVFEAIEGRHADYAPGSPDLSLVADLIARVGEIPVPEIPLRRAEERLRAYADPARLHHFAGDTLLHTDLNNVNVIVGGGRARLVDWAWATRGAPWLDAAYWVVWLIAAGHAPESAEQWAAEIPAFAAAPEAGVTAFAVATARLWQAVDTANPDSWTLRLSDASQSWCRFRAV
ncbi:hypothetical protein [Actinoplanes sp. NPDC051851]|uniref:phosphotransferase family protein n=1 Tax=Actinoplanes sp. NPDC051851 TaxID=3154753 RepID=UPI003425EDC6